MGDVANLLSLQNGDGGTATMTYTYDNRNRLIEEERCGTGVSPVEYHVSYTYDQGGNRLSKADWLSGVVTQYHYDIEDPETYHTLNNRLMFYEVFEGAELVERVEYEYGYDYGDIHHAAQGQPTYIVRKREDEDCYRATSVQYNKQGELWFAIDQTWELEWDPVGELWNCVNYELHSITEFHGSGRSRYITRQRYTDAANSVLPGTTRWSDYDDDVIYGDYVVDEDTGDITNTTAYLPGIAQMDTQTGNVMYLHSDQIGSLRAISTDYGEPIQRLVYTSFGENVYEDGTIGTRYQYAGAWGYQTSEDLPFVHVGHRYYDPSTGRFLQRDAIGILGGLNTYSYTDNIPTMYIDPFGLAWYNPFDYEPIARGFICLTGPGSRWNTTRYIPRMSTTRATAR